MNTYLLQRIVRDPVFWVIFPLALIVTPHFPRLPLWMILLVATLFMWRLLAIHNERLFPRKWVLFVITIFTAIGAVFHYGTIFGRTAGTGILIVLLGVKLLESRKLRDYMLLIALSFFVIVTNFLFSQTIPTVIFMFITVIILVMSLISINQNTAPIDIKSRFNFSLKLVAQALPLMIIMFVLFPRIPGPLWKLPDDSSIGITGLSDTMTPGNISNLIKSNALAFRVEFTDTVPAQNQLYWRALVLWYFDGRTWEQGNSNLNPDPRLEGFNKPVGYSITIEPHGKRWLFALDMPAGTPNNTYYTNDYLLRSTADVNSIFQYRVRSFLNYRIEQELSRWERNAGLKLPVNSNPKTIALAKQWRKQFTNDEDIVNHGLQFFNREEFVYTLQPPTTPGFDPVDQFLFETRRGFCEHYASSFTVLMRAAGIPSRVVIGYQGGTLNPLNGVFTVNQSDAHAWTEVWLKNRGWVRVDPTAAIAPNRIEYNLDSALAEDEFRPLHMRLDSGLIRQMRFYWDAMDNQWKQWIIGYGPKIQQQLLSVFFNRKLDYGEIILILVATFATATLIISLFIFKPFRKQSHDPVVLAYEKFCKKTARAGVVRDESEGPLDFSKRVQASFPTQSQAIELITRLYINLRYKSINSEKQLSSLQKYIQRLKLSAAETKKAS
ncbi:MAG TPA: DUF3488 and transglutaminase-like domain-containing protein [Gammaproteobacteria bacterium]